MRAASGLGLFCRVVVGLVIGIRAGLLFLGYLLGR